MERNEVVLNLLFDNIEEEEAWEDVYRSKHDVWYINLEPLENDEVCVLSAVMYK